MLPGMGSESLPVSRLEKLQIEVVGFEIRLPLGLVLFTLNLSPAPSLPHKALWVPRGEGEVVGRRGGDRGVAVKGTAASSMGIERLRRAWGWRTK